MQSTFLPEGAAHTLVQANITSRLVYRNGILYGLPNILIGQVQRVQNCAVRVVKQAGRYTNTTPILKELHWLTIKYKKYRIEYKIILLTFKALNGLAPPYLSDQVGDGSRL